MKTKKLVIDLFNSGVLKVKDAEFFTMQRYAFIFSAGVLVDVILED